MNKNYGETEPSQRSRHSNEDIKSWIQRLRCLGIEYKQAFKRSLPLTQELGELYACENLGLKRAVEGQTGYDAKDVQGRRVQIKSRAPQKQGVKKVDENGTVGRFTNFEFHYAVLVLLTDTYELDEIYQLDYKRLQELQPPNSRRGIRVRDFKNNGKLVRSVQAN